ncbi:MAG: DUF1593 domain-containing protein [Chitinivibrionales bacterium]|nr:DUF1593 domain-containing protein [Chitinivibrionales bacterium]
MGFIFPWEGRTMLRVEHLYLFLLIASVGFAHQRPRVVVTTDGEIDDKQSLVRFLHYCNEWDTEGLIYSNSIHHSVDNNWAGTDWMDEHIDAYEQDYPNLRIHDEKYPHPDELRAVISVGEQEKVGFPSSGGNGSTEGSDHIITLLEKDDDRPLFVQCWGGANTAAQALYDLKHNRGYTEEEAQRIGNRMVVYLITTQEQPDSKPWIQDNFPQVRLLFLSFGFVAYRPWEAPFHESWTKEWKDANLCGSGALGELVCGLNSWGQLVEGDTPSFLYNVPNGLRGMELPVYGSWGGRFYHYNRKSEDADKEFWHEAEDDGDLYKPLERWWTHTGNDYAARSSWCARGTYADANHAPLVGDVGSLNRTVMPGQTINLSCVNSSDPDGDQLSYKWYHYYTWDNSAWYTETDPWSVSSNVTVSNATQAVGASFTVPNEIGKHILITLEVTDNGTPPLTRYAQIDFDIQATVAAARPSVTTPSFGRPTFERNKQTFFLDGSVAPTTGRDIAAGIRVTRNRCSGSAVSHITVTP